MRRPFVWIPVAGLGVALASPHEATQAASAVTPQTRSIVAGKEFDRGGSWRYWFGEGYRKAWTTPVELPVLDLAAEAGGLAPVRQVGGFQTVGLAMKGADGRLFTFRKLEKHPERLLPEEWQDSELRAIAIDQTAAAHPAATVIIGRLAQSVGILFYGSRLAIMPDDPALGEFRETFANSVGTFDEYPAPGYKGITEIVSSKGLWEKWVEGGPQNRVDSRAFLKARLFDLVVGNWDRHQGQWRWARIEGRPRWEPVPEDADQALTRYEGKMMGVARSVVPRLMRYSGEYPKRIEGLTANNADVTRWLLADVEWPTYEEVARELAAAMTDAVIDDAMKAMPPEWYAVDGAQMTKDLRQRRDGIVAYARRFYLHLADRVDVRGTDQADLARVRHLEGGALEVTLAPDDPAGSAAPYYRRRFSPEETEEIRLYLLGGRDRLLATGPRQGGIRVRVLGGAGDDTLDDSGGGGAHLQDDQGRNAFLRGPGTHVDEDAWTNPVPQEDRPWVEPRGYGHWTVPMIQAWWQPNQEVMFGGGFTRTAWSFRKYPWASMQTFTLLYSTGYNKFKASYSGDWRLNHETLLGGVDLLASGVENENYFGFGNETPPIEDKTLHKTEDYTLSIFPALRYEPSSSFELRAGVEAKAVEPRGGDSLVETEQPYGTGRFGEIVIRAGFEYDTRGRTLSLTAQRVLTAPGATVPGGAPVGGIRIQGEAFFVPKGWDVTEKFGGIDGSVAGYFGSHRLALATRVGGRKLWGPYPWFESATIGGSSTVRGYDSNRFRGDSSLFANAELRFWMGVRKKAVLPLRWGLTAFAESGRVWYQGEESDKWHTGYGAGLMTQLVGTPLTLQGSIANGSEGVHFYVKGGYSF